MTVLPSIVAAFTVFTLLRKLFKDHTGEGHRGSRFPREGLAVFEIPSPIPVQKMNEGIKRGKTTNPSAVLILCYLVEKPPRIEGRQPLDQQVVLVADPLEKFRRDFFAVSELPANVSQIDASDEADLPRFFSGQLLQSA